MARFLIEVPHQETKAECARAVELFLRTGSHFLRNADWGCKDGEHKAWIIVEVDSEDEAQASHRATAISPADEDRSAELVYHGGHRGHPSPS
jgi:hypothetical protein